MLPQRLATWLSATRKQPVGQRLHQFRDGAAVEDAVAEIREHHRVGRHLLHRARAISSRIWSEIERLSSVSTLSSR